MNDVGFGLSDKEVLAFSRKFGYNEFPEKRENGWEKILFRQFVNPLIAVLLFAFSVTIYIRDSKSALFISIAVLVNVIVGFLQEFKSMRAFDKLKSYIKPTARVRRGGVDLIILAREIVPGDIMAIQSGDRVSADSKIISSFDMEADESILTGESMPIAKRKEDALFAGTIIKNGHGWAEVTKIGINTEFGKIASQVSEIREEKTPLQNQLADLSKFLAIIFVALSILIAVAGVLLGRGIQEMISVSLAIAVAAIPEGLLVAMTTTMAISMRRMFNRKALVKRLLATETLGSVNVICTDKTGTLTQASMELTDLVTAEKAISAKSFSVLEQARVEMFAIEAGVLCNNAQILGAESGLSKIQFIGSPTETAVARAGLLVGIRKHEHELKHKRLDEIAFNSTRKFMATLNEWKDGENAIFVTGAAENLLNLCEKVELARGTEKLNDEMRKKLSAELKVLTKNGLRVLVCAVKTVGREKAEIELSDIQNLTFLGFFGLRDPIRPDARQTIQQAKSAGVRTIIITGDHPQTAIAIAKEAGIDYEQIMIGAEIDKTSDSELKKIVAKTSIFARVNPAHKVRIVNALRSRGDVVAMTGDGVNDAPALKAADIGIALGSGTDVAREVSDIILLDDSLSTIVSAIEEGRVIYDNIKRIIIFLLITMFTELCLIALSVLFGLPLALLATQILWINVITDVLPAIPLAMEPKESGIMVEKPRKRNEKLITSSGKIFIYGLGVIFSVMQFLFYILMLNAGVDVSYARSVLFVLVSIEALIFAVALRNFRQPFYKLNFFSNPLLLVGIFAGLLFTVLPIFFAPLAEMMGLTAISVYSIFIICVVALSKFLIVEYYKRFVYTQLSGKL